MTDNGWEDYVDLSGVDPDDPSQAVTDISDAVTDFAAETAEVGGVTDLDQVTLDTAAYQTDLAEGDQSWADWNADNAAASAGDAAEYAADAETALSQGDVAGAEWSAAQAERYAGTAEEWADAAEVNDGQVDGHLADAEASLDSVDYSGLDSTSYDAGLDSTNYDSGIDSGLDSGLDSGVDATDYSGDI